MDLKSFSVQKKLAKRKIKPAYFVLAALISILIALPFGIYQFFANDSTTVVDSTVLSLPEAEVAAEAPEPEEPNIGPRSYTLTVKNGDTLDSILRRYGVDGPTIGKLKQAANHAHYLSDLRPNQSVKLLFDPTGALQTLTLTINLKRDLTFQRDGQGHYSAKFSTKALETRTKYGSAIVQYSVSSAGLREKIPAAIITQLTQIFGSQIDFKRDIQPGDRFALVYNDYYIGDQKVKTGEILAAEFVNHGETHKAVRYTDRSGESAYYTPEGKSLRKGFSRYPVNFSHISSSFNLNRKHPILGYHRPHRGTDYAAPMGTPIRASGNGRIIFIGRDGGYGRVIRIQHTNQYMTLYAHMLRFQKGLKRGDYVKQNQIIGYVGQSGLADGPHVHYEFHVAGKAVNPVTVKLPLANEIERNYVNLFKAQAKNLLSQLELYSQSKFAA